MKTFHGTEVLKGIDLDVQRGQVVCLLGPSGSGKTTFLRCINQLETIDGGRIWVDGDLVGFRERGRPPAPPHRQAGRRPAARDRHGLPALQPLPAHDGAREHLRGADPGQGRRQEGGRERGRGPARAGRPRRQAGRLPRAALRWPAAARRDRPGARDGPQAHALRRADLGPRPRARRRRARRHARPRRPGHDDDRRHARDGLRPRRRRPASSSWTAASSSSRAGPTDVLGNPQHERTRTFLGRMRTEDARSMPTSRPRPTSRRRRRRHR